MNEDICKRIVRRLVGFPHYDKFDEYCDRPKNPDFLYCESCMREVFDEKPSSFSQQ